MAEYAYKGVPQPDPVPAYGDYITAWRDGVDAVLVSRGTRTTVVPAAGDIAFVRAFAEILRDNQTAARVLVQDMSPRDRALLSWALKELSYAVDDVEDMRRTGLTVSYTKGQPG